MKITACLAAALLSLAGPAAAQPDRAWAVDAGASRLTVKTDSAGMLKRFGHRHVIAAGAIRGEIDYTGGAGSTAWLEIPVAQLAVDDPADRAAAGEGFDKQPDEKEVAGTRDNMLGEELLYADRHPIVRVELELLSVRGDTARFDADITVRGATHTHQLPGTLVVADGVMKATAVFSLDHADLGLDPFKAFAGAVKVAEALEFEVEITALPK